MPLPWTYAVKTTAIVASPSDSNDGHDPIGFALSGASYNGATKTLTKAGAFAGYTWASGDWCWLTGTNANSDVIDGAYEIASNPTDDTITLVAGDPFLDYDDNGSGYNSSTGPWLTLQHAFDTMSTAGQTLVICHDGGGTDISDAWEDATTLDIDTNTGSASEPLRYRGANARGVIDGTQAILNGVNLSSDVPVVTFGGSLQMLSFHDLRMTGATGTSGHGVAEPTISAVLVRWNRCRFDNNGGSGLWVSSNDWKYYDCEIDHNGVDGYTPPAGARGAATLTRCRVHHNSRYGILANSQPFAINDCAIYRNTGHGIYAYHITDHNINDCVVALNGGSGLYTDGSVTNAGEFGKLVNITFRSNGGYGINNSTTRTFLEIDYCCFSGNTSGATNGCDEYLGAHNIYADPLFVSEVDGSEDFTPGTGSPLIDANLQVEVN